MIAPSGRNKAKIRPRMGTNNNFFPSAKTDVTNINAISAQYKEVENPANDAKDVM